MPGLGLMNHCLKSFLRTDGTNAFHPCVCQQGDGIITNHTFPVAWTRPLGHEPTFIVSIEDGLGNPLGNFRI